MKRLLICALAISLVGCDNAGTSYQKLDGTETGLPDELKGLKIYDVSTGGGNSVKVAVIGNTMSSTYSKGKYHETTILIDNSNRTIYAKEILSETDSIIVIRK